MRPFPLFRLVMFVAAYLVAALLWPVFLRDHDAARLPLFACFMVCFWAFYGVAVFLKDVLTRWDDGAQPQAPVVSAELDAELAVAA